MLARVNSGAVLGLDGILVQVEVDIVKKGFPGFAIVGLPGKAVEEAKERVKSALINSSAQFPKYKITVNLAPADLRKQGPAYDLPIALGILLADEQCTMSRYIEESLWLGELSLDGSIRPTSGVLPMALLAKEKGFKRIFVPQHNAQEAAVVRGIEVIPLNSLTQVHAFLSQEQPELVPEVFDTSIFTKYTDKTSTYDFKHIYGQENAKRALEIAAAGGHNVIMIGPPGSGKTLLARAFSMIIPPLSERETLEVTKIYSIAGRLDTNRPLIVERPFRAPHHTISRVGLVGGGHSLQPGEISLAHRGVLFLDEFPEFPRSVLESLRQPLEDGWVHISRAHGSVMYPSKCTLIAAANPCPCGFRGSSVRQCTCSEFHVQKYQKRVSGPILDRIDLHISVPMVEIDKIISGHREIGAEESGAVRYRVTQARNIQQKRFDTTDIFINAEMDAQQMKEFCKVRPEGEYILKRAIGSMGLSVRGVHKVLKVARTIADLSGSIEIEVEHLVEALNYRFTLH